jgi:hypothetical protein
MMRLNIQYSAEMDEIPSEIQKVVDSTAHARLQEACDRLASLDFEDGSSFVLGELDAIRKVLYLVDERLSDADGIMRGYYVQQAAQMQSEAQPEAQPHLEPTGQPPADGVAAPLPASQEIMQTIKAELSAHKNETDALRRTFQQGLCGPSTHLNEADGGDS